MARDNSQSQIEDASFIKLVENLSTGQRINNTQGGE